MHKVDDRLRVALAMFSVGILAFIFMDVSTHGQEIVQTALGQFKAHRSGFGHVLAMFALLAAGFTLGTAGISAAERRLRPRAPVTPPIAGGDAAVELSAGEVAAYDAEAAEARRRALQTGMTIAVAIGLHNFAEGLAIGVSAKAGAIGLATVLVVGFGLHNATEGFGIVGPLGRVRPSWSWLALAGLVAGGPTFLGTIVGYQVHSESLELCFYALAGGAILYVIGEIWTGMRRYGHRTLGLYLISAGFLVGVATDLIVSYGGG
jgi:ZIP family zinc transporter